MNAQPELLPLAETAALPVKNCGKCGSHFRAQPDQMLCSECRYWQWYASPPHPKTEPWKGEG